MRDLMNEATVVPPWLHDTFLGYGDPAAAQYSKLPDAFVRTIDFKVPLSHTLVGLSCSISTSGGAWLCMQFSELYLAEESSHCS